MLLSDLNVYIMYRICVLLLSIVKRNQLALWLKLMDASIC